MILFFQSMNMPTIYFFRPVFANNIIRIMHQDQQQRKNRQSQICKKVLKDKQVLHLFLRQLSELPKGVCEVNATFDRIYILFHLNKYHQSIQPQQQSYISDLHKKKSFDVDSKYVLKIGKNFPMNNSVRLHLLEGGFQPQISDCRDFFKTVMGKPFDYRIRLVDILVPLMQFDKTLHHKNENFLEMQKIGQFMLGDSFYYHQLVEYFSSLILLKDITNQEKINTYLGISQTHLLVFKEIVVKNRQTHQLSNMRHHHSLIAKNEKEVGIVESEATFNKLVLISCAELQCIDSISCRESQKVIKLVLKKYKNIMRYNEFEEVKKQYKFNQPELFLRRVLKYITKFQACQIKFEPFKTKGKMERRSSSGPSKNKDDVIAERIQQCSWLQAQVKLELNEIQRNKKLETINKLYQKLIDYYSARANPYYLIFVNKLNALYVKYYSSSSSNHDKPVLPKEQPILSKEQPVISKEQPLDT